MDEAEFGYSISGHRAHHDFIWDERVWFAEHGIDVNDPAFGRWMPSKKHKEWHKGAGGV